MPSTLTHLTNHDINCLNQPQLSPFDHQVENFQVVKPPAIPLPYSYNPSIYYLDFSVCPPRVFSGTLVNFLF